MLGQLVVHRTVVCNDCAFVSQPLCKQIKRSLFRRHAYRAKLAGNRYNGHTPSVRCSHAAVSDLEDVDPVTGEVVTAVKSKIPK